MHDVAAGHRPPSAAQSPLVPAGVLGMMLLILCEIMFFAALISAYQIARAGVPEWPPADQPRLPAWRTAINTAFLLLSGLLMHVTHRWYRRDEDARTPRVRSGFLLAIVCGALFVVLQGGEWFQLLQHGLTLTSSSYGSYFYVIIGAHGLHAIGGLVGLVWLWWRMKRDRLTLGAFWAGETFWYFVVGVWPVLYAVVYLA